MKSKDETAGSKPTSKFPLRLPSSVHTALSTISSAQEKTLTKKIEEVLEAAMAGELDLNEYKEPVQQTQVGVNPDVARRFVEFAKSQNRTVNGLARCAIESAIRNTPTEELFARIDARIYKHRHSNSQRPPLPPTKDAA